MFTYTTLFMLQAVCSVLGQQRATIQLQGSIAKGTGLKDSDWDFFVPLNHPDDTVTHKERSRIRVLLADIFASNGIDYYMQPRSNSANRIHLWAGDDATGPLPDVDTVFEGFKRDRKHRPNNKLLARSQEAQQVSNIRLIAGNMKCVGPTTLDQLL